MFQRTILGALVMAAGVAAGLIVRQLTEKKEENNDELTEDEEIRFIHISDDEETEPERSQEVKEICAVYPYLEADFVEDVLKQNASLNDKYPEDTLVNVLHRARFSTHESLEMFMDIMEENGYECSARGETELTASRKFFTQPGAIISDILNVANQAAALKGTYTDYVISEQ